MKLHTHASRSILIMKNKVRSKDQSSIRFERAQCMLCCPRELYSEKKVIEEERRLRVDNSPGGRFQLGFAQASLSNNYRRSVIGSAEDFDGLGRREVEDFFKRLVDTKQPCLIAAGSTVHTRLVHAILNMYGGSLQRMFRVMSRRLASGASPPGMKPVWLG